eukprot:jgi/Psemu1/184676/e_gw1.41.118.1
MVLGILCIYNCAQNTQEIPPPFIGAVPKKFPQDSYSFVSIFSPKDQPDEFFFGIMVFLFQAALFILMIMSVVSKNSRTTGEVDNPDADVDWLAGFIPANAPPIVRATQIIALLSYVIFPDASLLEIVMAVDMFPRLRKTRMKGGVFCMTLSCVLRIVQGSLAIFAVFLLVITSSDVMEIVLNFTAANLISLLDDSAFKMARAGKYGWTLEKAARKVETQPIPSYSISQHRTRRSRISVSVVGVLLFGFCSFVIYSQESSKKWITRTIQIKFQNSLQEFSGCYDLTEDSTHDKRHSYQLLAANNTWIGYCKNNRQWVLFNGEDNPCLSTEENTAAAYSSKTDSFDVSNSFTEPWYSVKNEPLDFFVADLGNNQQDFCENYVGDGICNVFFNTAEYNYDGGDCCYVTCKQSNCGEGGLNRDTVFGTKISSGDGYNNCEDPSLKELVIKLDSVVLNDELPKPTIKFECDGKTVFSVHLQDSMKKESMKVMVSPVANCMLDLESSKDDNGASSKVKYTISDSLRTYSSGMISTVATNDYFSVCESALIASR